MLQYFAYCNRLLCNKLNGLLYNKQRNTTLESYAITMQFFASCPKQCNIRRVTIDQAKIKQKPIQKVGMVQLDIYFQVTPERIFNREYLIYDGLGMFGSIGGSLGLFVGFSIYDTLCLVVDFVQKKFNLF